MSSTSVGDAFELKIFEFFQKLISDGLFWAKEECCLVSQKKGYYSKDREKDIIFDLSIEVTMPGATSYSLLTLIECKNYTHKVPIDDAEEFWAKLEQVAVANGKGIIASASPFQESTIKFCRSKGIALLRYFDDTKVKWELNRSPSAVVFTPSLQYKQINPEGFRALTSDEYQSNYFDCFCYDDGIFTNSLRDFFVNIARKLGIANSTIARLQNASRNADELVPYISQGDIEALVNEVLEQIAYSQGAVPLEDICQWQSSANGLRVYRGVRPSAEEVKAGIIGRIKFNPLEIIILDYPNGNIGRQRFTLAHELGHYLLGHSRYIAGEYYQEKDAEPATVSELVQEDIRRLEWQANHFASCLLLPEDAFVTSFFVQAELRGIRNRGFGALYVDDQKENRRNYMEITDALMSKYKVSRTVVTVRLKKLNLLNDNQSRLERAFGHDWVKVFNG